LLLRRALPPWVDRSSPAARHTPTCVTHLFAVKQLQYDGTPRFAILRRASKQSVGISYFASFHNYTNTKPHLAWGITGALATSLGCTFPHKLKQCKRHNDARSKLKKKYHNIIAHYGKPPTHLPSHSRKPTFSSTL
jgi:hypothetical protein